jgi:hypothetical protein
VIGTLALAATLALSPEFRVAGPHVGATNDYDRLLALDADRAIVYRRSDALRSAPLDDPAKSTTIVAGQYLDNAIAAPPLVAWKDWQTHVAPIDAPDRGTILPHDTTIQSMQCNAKACLATTEHEILFLHLDGTISARTTYIPQPGSGPILASDPEGFLLVSSYRTVQRVGNDGVITFTTTTPGLLNPTADFDGTRYAMAWEERDASGPGSTLRAASVSLDGKVGAPATLAALPVRTFGRIALAYGAGRHLLVYGQPDSPPYAPNDVPRTRLRALRLDGALQTIDAKPLSVDETTWADLDVAATARGNEFLVAWTHAASGSEGDPEAAVIDAGGKVGPRMLLSRGIAQQYASSVATVSGALLAGYVESPREEGTSTLRVRRFAAGGTAIGEPIDVAKNSFLSSMTTRGDDVLLGYLAGFINANAAIVRADGSLQRVDLPYLQFRPSVAASRNGWMFVAQGSNDSLVAVRIDPNGNASSPEAIAQIPSGNVQAWAVASDGDRFLVAWASSDGAYTRLCSLQPCGTRVTLLDATGGVLKSNIPISAKSDLTEATFAGGEYFVATTTGVRLDRDGNILGEVNAHASRVAPFGNAVVAAEYAADSTRFVVFDHGAAVAETTIDARMPLLSEDGIAYTAKVGDDNVAVLRTFIPERRRAAYH